MTSRTHHLLRPALATAGCVLLGVPASADVVVWVSPGDGSWHDGFNWSTEDPPAPGDDVLVSMSGITVAHSQGASLVNSIDCDADFKLLGASSLGFSAGAEFAASMLLDTSGGLFAPGNSEVKLSGPTTWDDGTLGGTGTFRNLDTIEAGGLGERILEAKLENQGTLTQDAAMHVSASGAITNHAAALWSSSGGATVLGPAQNDGWIDALSNTVSFMGGFDNRPNGLLSIGPSAEVAWNGGSILNRGDVELAGGISLGGTFQNLEGGTFTILGMTTIDGAPSGSFQNAGTLVLDTGGSVQICGIKGENNGAIEFGPDASLELLDLSTLTNTGSISIVSGATFDAATPYIQTAGSTNIEGGVLIAAEGVQVIAGSIGCYGPVIANLEIGSAESAAGSAGDPIALADPRPSPGCLSVEGAYKQHPDGGLDIGFDVLEPPLGCSEGLGAPHDLLTVTGSATLGGTLIVRLESAFDPPDDAAYDVLIAEAVEGEFDVVTVPAIAGGRTFSVNYGPDAVRLLVIASPCPGDLDMSGHVDVSDLLQLLGDWGGGPGIASDIDGNGGVDVIDLLALLGAWGQCP